MQLLNAVTLGRYIKTLLILMNNIYLIYTKRNNNIKCEVSALDNSVIIKGSKSGITVFLDNEMPFEELLESVQIKFKNASSSLIMLIWQFLLMEEIYLQKKIAILYRMYRAYLILIDTFLMRIMT